METWSSVGVFDSMEAAAGVAAATTARGASLQMPPSSRKEWRAVADHHTARNPGDEVVFWWENN